MQHPSCLKLPRPPQRPAESRQAVRHGQEASPRRGQGGAPPGGGAGGGVQARGPQHHAGLPGGGRHLLLKTRAIWKQGKKTDV